MVTLKTESLSCTIQTLGATLSHLCVEDGKGVIRDVVLGFDEVSGYKTPKNRFFGATVGRVANRIEGGKFDLHNKQYQLAVNNGPNALHGGLVGFGQREWTVVSQDDASVTLRYVSADGEEGYPGELTIEVAYSVKDKALRIDYRAWLSGADNVPSTIVNLTNHSYFNLSGQPKSIIDDHLFHFIADRYLPLDNTSVPLGTIEPTANLPLDLTQRQKLNGKIQKLGMGFDHCYVLKEQADGQLKHAATVECDGLTMKYSTTEPGFQFYTANYLDASNQSGKLAHKFNNCSQWCGFCLESQRFPDAINKKSWAPTVVLERGKEYRQTTIYEFSH